MNKQELIEKYKELEAGSFDIAAIVVCQLVLKDLEQRRGRKAVFGEDKRDLWKSRNFEP